jgi:hypothetical protein
MIFDYSDFAPVQRIVLVLQYMHNFYVKNMRKMQKTIRFGARV